MGKSITKTSLNQGSLLLTNYPYEKEKPKEHPKNPARSDTKSPLSNSAKPSIIKRSSVNSTPSQNDPGTLKKKVKYDDLESEMQKILEEEGEYDSPLVTKIKAKSIEFAPVDNSEAQDAQKTGGWNIQLEP